MLLQAGLDLSSTGALRRMASVHGLVHDDATTRAELIDRLAERLLDPIYLHEQLDRVADDERATLAAARASGGELRGLLVERDYPGAGEALIERGLLFRIFAAAGPLRGEVFEVPQEILAALPEPPSIDAPPAGETPPTERRASDPAFSLMALVSALTRSGGSLEEEVREWSEEPGGWEWQARWLFLRHLAQTAGLLVHRADGALTAGPTLSRLLDDPSALADRLWRGYLQDRAWSELDQAGVRFEDGQALADTVPLRKALVDAVLALPEGAWIGFEALSDWLRSARPVAVREQLNARGLVLIESATWAELERPLLRYVVLGPLYWLGIVGASADGRSIVRRAGASASVRKPSPGRTDTVAAEGDRLPGRTNSSSAEARDPPPRRTTSSSAEAGDPGPGRTAMDEGEAGDAPPRRSATGEAEGGGQASGDIRTRMRPAAFEACFWDASGAELVAPTRTSLGTLLDAERYLVLRRRGRPSHYHLVQARVAAALGSGGSIGECRRLLRKLTQGPLPETVDDRLNAWERRFGAVGVRPAVLIEARSAHELDDAIADERVRPFVRARLGPTVAEVPAADVLELAAALRDGGHLPSVDAALRLAAEPRRAYAGLVDEQVLEFLLVGLLAFQRARPEYLGELEGSLSLLERLERQFPPERLGQLRAAAARLAGELGASGGRKRAVPARPRPRRARTPRL